jgi:hypothetical protein
MVMLAAVPEGTDLKPVPGDPGLPYLGYILAGLKDPVALSRKRFARHGPVSWSNFLGKRLVTLQGPDAAEAVLVNRDKAFANGPAWGFFIGPFFYRGIMLLDFEEHLHHRRIMQQAFTRARLQSYLAGMSAGVAEGLRYVGDGESRPPSSSQPFGSLWDDGAEPVGTTPAEFAAHIKSELEKWTNVARVAKIEPQ